jgi:hypothetical protein
MLVFIHFSSVINFITESLKCSIFNVSIAGKDYLIEALKYHLLKGEQKILFKTPRTKPRQPVGLPKVCNMFICKSVCYAFLKI